MIMMLQEPVPGWIDNLNGPTGFFLIAGLGVLRTAVIHDKLKIDAVPVDTCASIIIAAAHQTAVNHRQGNSTIKIYNHVSGPQAPLTWGDSYSMARTALLKYPFENVVWYPVSSFNNNEIENKVLGFLLQDVPARVTDLIMQMLGRKVFAVRLSSKMQTGLRAMKYFTSNEWRWENPSSQELFNSLSPDDKLEFNFSVESISWDIFINNFVQGLRKYVLKQDPSTIPATRTKLRKLYFAHIAVQTLGCLVLLWLVYLVYSGIH
ncbi:putative fatty acyl-CoA reductase CG5065 [Eurytemora carolleeae]|uniref:putative fatty acyl-CoA reductase CG5065 n=1 Tax=Eurytemora carolleeae TaxID=1294199 RepID=UPI000C76A0B3|nr:putative fatty acyl-CoA reductase CG5065 [Eurytemora carolleeae]|eukprot:XP_023334879.1 putative fatty acyl-CoA reductase CG5065 [Eurytemora affinis]